MVVLHPFAPFVTETIWQTLYPKTETMLINQQWSATVSYDKAKVEEFDKLKSIITEARHIKTILGASGGTLVHSGSDVVGDNQKVLKKLADLDNIKELVEARGIALTETDEGCHIDLGEENAKRLVTNLEDRQNKIADSIKMLEGRLQNKNYVSKAPPKLVAESKEQLELKKSELAKIQALIKNYS